MFGFTQRNKTVKEVCRHVKAVPRWDRMEDTGNPGRISTYYCPDCDRFLPPSEFVAQPAEQPSPHG